MLRDQVFAKPVTIGIGHELFFDPTSRTGFNFNFVAAFKSQVQFMSGYSYVFVDDENAPVPGGIHKFVATLESLGISLQNVFLFDPKDVAQLAELNAFLGTLDLVYAPSLVHTAPGIIHRRLSCALPPLGFAECLLSLVQIPTPFSLQNFRQLENQWQAKHSCPPITNYVS